MKFVILLCLLAALVWELEASPVKLLERESRAVARQQTNNDVAPPVQSSADDDEDDDEDDDDDDEPDLGDLVDDDDDDDEEEEDDDDEEVDDTPQGQAAPASGAASDDDEEDDDDDDYLDRLFDDILGDDEEEDDDDDEPAAAPVNAPSNAAAAASSPVEANAPAPAVSSGISDGVDLPLESGNAAEPNSAANTVEDIAAAAAAGNSANDASSNNNNNEGEQNVFYDEDALVGGSSGGTLVSSFINSNSIDDKHTQNTNQIQQIQQIQNQNQNQASTSPNSNNLKQQQSKQQQQQQQQQQQLNTITKNTLTNESSNKIENLLSQNQNQPAAVTAGAATGAAATKLKGQNVAAAAAGSAAAVAAAADDDEDADDDDDDDDDDIGYDDNEIDDGVGEITGALTGDDDEEEEADDDEEDDDDDIIGDDVIEARREARDLKNNVIDMSSDVFQSRHNHFIDAIFTRINRIVADNYDPFVVRLAGRAAGDVNGASSNKQQQKRKKNKNTTSNRKQKEEQSEGRSATDVDTPKEEAPTKSEELEVPSKPAESAEVRTVHTAPSKSNTGKKSIAHKSSQSNVQGQSQKTKDAQHKKYTAPQNELTKELEKLQNTEGSLSGLASLKRVGNVKVLPDPEGRNSTIKAKFTLGPLILRVEKSYKRGSVRNVKFATARTNQMIGRIKFSVVDDRATLMSIKVQQPKQVEVEAKENQDRSHDLVWRRTPKLAKLVNEKLKLAAESIFTPQGVEIVRL